jgi:hypothetical protein
VWVQVTSRITRAAILGRRGELAAAEELARMAGALVARTDFLTLRAYVHSVMALLLFQSGRPGEAAGEAQSAIAAYELKGDVASAGRIRAVLEHLSRPAAPH